MNMNKTIKKALQFTALIIMMLLSFSVKMCINSCHHMRHKNSTEVKQTSSIERIDEFANHMNSICPIYFESWARIESITLSDSKQAMIIRVCVDDDFIESYSKSTFILAVHQQFENENKDFDYFKKDMESTNMMMTFIICNNNGDVLEKETLRPKDFESFSRYYESTDNNRKLNETMQQAKTISNLNIYNY